MSQSSMTVSRRLLLSFGAVIATFSMVAATALWTSSTLEELESWNVHTYEVLASANDMLDGMVNMETGARGFLLSGEDSFLEPWKGGLSHFEEGWQHAKKLTADNAEQQRRLDAIKTSHVRFVEVANSYITSRRAVREGKHQMADLLSDFMKGRDKAAMDEFRTLQADFAKAESTLLEQRSRAAADARALNHWAIIIGSIMALGIAAAMGLWVTRALRLALGAEPADLNAVMVRMASGELNQPLQVDARYNNSVLASVARMQEDLSRVVATVRASSDSIATGSSQIAAGNVDLSQRTEEQASALEETAATMEELSSTVRTNAESAKQANQLAQGAAGVPSQGGEVVNQVVSTMQGISDSSRKIGDIISVIDGIAFQTNILALNAAVEAARAGEQGRGFAVVASEVRTLAQRSAGAAKEIKTLIESNVAQVQQGTALVDQAGTTMKEIVDSIRRVSDIVAEITSATIEQSNGIDQVGEAVSQMDQVTQQNAALVEESAAAAENLNTQAQQLVEVVSVFKLSNSAVASFVAESHHAPKASAPKASSPKPAAPRPTIKPVSHVNGQAAKKKPAALPKPAAAKIAPAAVPGTTDDDGWTTF